MPTVQLTKKNTESLRKQGLARIQSEGLREVIYWDEQLTGLGLRVGKSGKATWIVYRRIRHGGEKAKQVLTAIGSLGEMDIDQARDKAQSVLEDIRKGSNPNETKRTLRDEDREAFRNGKLKDVISLWFDKKNLQGDYSNEVSRMINNDILVWFGEAKPVRDITRKDIIGLIDSKPRGSARSLFAILRPFMAWCVEREYRQDNPILNLNPPAPFEARDRVLTDYELGLVWKASLALGYPWGPFYRLLILTAQRRDEVAGMAWSELDAHHTEWIIPGYRTKNGKEHLVHLSPSASLVCDYLFGRAPRTVGDHFASPYLFTTTRETHISGFSKAKIQLDEQIKLLNDNNEIPPWRIHDIRRTVATGLRGLKVPPHIIEKILNHTSGVNGGIVGVYQRYEDTEERREALIKWANHVQSIVTPKQQANNVVAIRA